MKRWVQIFKVFANINRLKIVKLLAGTDKMTVSDIADELDISLKSTSKHLIILDNIDVLEGSGKSGHVYYWLNQAMPGDLKKIIRQFI